MKTLQTLLLSLLIGLSSLAGAPAFAAQANRIVAIVNNDVITTGELYDRAHVTALNLRRQNISLPPMQQLRGQVLQQLIMERIMEQEARSQGIRVEDAFLNVAIERIARQNNLTVPQLKAALAKDGVPFDRFRTQVRGQILAQRLRERQVDDKIEIPESEIEAFLAEQAGFNVHDQMQYHVLHISVPLSVSMSYSERREAREKAERILADARKNIDFQQLAAGLSGASDALEGGDLGWKTLSELTPSLAKTVKEAFARSDRVGFAESESGYDIVKVLARRNGVQAKLSGGPVEQTRARHILLTPSASMPESVVLARMNELRDRIVLHNEDFATLARLNSTDGSATRGGDLGWLQKGDTVPPFEQAMMKLKVGEVSQPVRSPFGFHLIQVTERRTQDADPQRLRYNARQILRERKLSQAVANWQRELRAKAFVEIRNEAL